MGKKILASKIRNRILPGITASMIKKKAPEVTRLYPLESKDPKDTGKTCITLIKNKYDPQIKDHPNSPGTIRKR